MDFNETKASYRASVNDSLKFVGKDHDFFTRVKADALVRALRSFMPEVARPRVLDVGCGHGFVHPYLLRAGCEMVGVDVAADVLGLAKEANPGVEYIGYDGERLPFGANAFDAAVAICVMHHVAPADWAQFLAEMKRVVRPGGVTVIFEHNPYNPLTRYVVRNNEMDEGATLLPYPTLCRLMKKSGYQQVQTRNILFTPLEGAVFRWLDRQMWWCPFGAQYMVSGRAGLA